MNIATRKFAALNSGPPVWKTTPTPWLLWNAARMIANTNRPSNSNSTPGVVDHRDHAHAEEALLVAELREIGAVVDAGARRGTCGRGQLDLLRDWSSPCFV